MSPSSAADILLSLRATLRGSASDDDLLVAAAASSRALPDDYVSFLRASDGAEGRIGKNYLQIFSAKQAAETTTGFAAFVPSLFFFASDGAEGLFAFDLRDEDRHVVITHTDDLNSEGLVRVAKSFTSFLRFLQGGSWSEFWFAERTRMSHRSQS